MKMLNKSNSNVKNQSGFTLVELSIVLVIIGLIISSVMVGQDLVRSAELRASVTQLEGFNAAIGTFKGKYNGLPGDVAGNTNFGFTGNGNGNGVLVASTLLTAAENVFFWSHLGSTGAALISGSYNGVSIDTDDTATDAIAANLPSSKAGNYWGVYAGPAAATVEGVTSGSEAGTNYYILGVSGSTTAGAYATTATLTPLEAQNIDSKMDDGKPSTGIVRARGASATDADTVPTSAAAGGTTTCTSYVATSYTTAVTTNTYTTAATSALCTLRFKMPL